MPIRYEISPQGTLAFYKLSEPKADAGVKKIYFHPLAFAKMAFLINRQLEEVAWHGLVSRKAPDVFEIEDILVYPQIVSGDTIDMDQVPYQTWLMRLDNDRFFKMRMQGHSHVNMGISPSSTDIDHQSKIVAMLEEDMFYIFMIWNKSFKCNIFLYDACERMVYRGTEVLLDVLSAKSLQPTGFSFTTEKVSGLVSNFEPQIADFYDEAVKLIREPVRAEPPATAKKKRESGARKVKGVLSHSAAIPGRFIAGIVDE